MNVPLSKIVGLAALVLIVLLALTACAPAPTPTSVPPPAAPTVAAIQPTVAPPAAPAKPVALAVSTNDKFGKILTDGSGRTLYVFTQDTKDTPTCYDACATRWPPFLTQGKTDAMTGTGIDAASIGSAKRKDGMMQVTYKGSPLYYWNADTKPGDTLGQGIGGIWWIVSPNGTEIKTSAATAPAAPAQSVALAVSTNAKFGKILTDGSGRTLYVFAQDTKDTPTCYDACATRWPPFLTQGKTDAMNGIDAASIGSAKRKDGTMQVTYNSLPLYYWNADTKLGDTLGQGIGGIWWIVSPNGTEIKTSAATAPAAPTTSTSGNSNYGYGN